MDRSDAIQEILQYIRFDMSGIDEKVKNIESKVPDLFEEDNGINIDMDKSIWDEDYIATLIVKIRKNFSRKKLEHLKEVRTYVRGEIKEKKDFSDDIRGNECSKGKRPETIIDDKNNAEKKKINTSNIQCYKKDTIIQHIKKKGLKIIKIVKDKYFGKIEK
ncbi:hypothetical protein ACQ9ZF_11050 (plasmid) [Cetobacterium somerae]|uniref:hypothetical protein n=1 Tax=Cetobacterium somerae TaxID=188913 RepID=UPI003D76A2F2